MFTGTFVIQVKNIDDGSRCVEVFDVDTGVKSSFYSVEEVPVYFFENGEKIHLETEREKVTTNEYIVIDKETENYVSFTNEPGAKVEAHVPTNGDMFWLEVNQRSQATWNIVSLKLFEWEGTIGGDGEVGNLISECE